MKHADEMLAEAESLVRETAALCRKALLRKSSPLAVQCTWNPEIVISWHGHRRCSRGNAERISMAMVHLVPNRPEQNCLFQEYATIRNDPTIGSFISADWRDKVMVVTAHEMAHSAQYAPIRRDSAWSVLYRKPHGHGWQRLYAFLRHELGLNERIRAAGGVVGGNRIKTLSAALDGLDDDKRFNFRSDGKGQIHLALTEGRARLRARVIRRSDETLCKGVLAWNLDPPKGSLLTTCLKCQSLYASLVAGL